MPRRLKATLKITNNSFLSFAGLTNSDCESPTIATMVAKANRATTTGTTAVHWWLWPMVASKRKIPSRMLPEKITLRSCFEIALTLRLAAYLGTLSNQAGAIKTLECIDEQAKKFLG